MNIINKAEAFRDIYGEGIVFWSMIVGAVIATIIFLWEYIKEFILTFLVVAYCVAIVTLFSPVLIVIGFILLGMITVLMVMDVRIEIW